MAPELLKRSRFEGIALGTRFGLDGQRGEGRIGAALGKRHARGIERIDHGGNALDGGACGRCWH
jgi:hypothetical protein